MSYTRKKFSWILWQAGVYIAPMAVMIDKETYYEGVALTHEKFYRLFSEGRDASSSQPTLGSIMEIWDKVLSEGYGEIVHIPMSSGLSGSCRSGAGALGMGISKKI